MKNAKAKITGIALLSMIALTGCDMGSPVAPAKESSIPSEQINDSDKSSSPPNANNSFETSETKEPVDGIDTPLGDLSTKEQNQKNLDPSTEPTFEANEYESIEKIDFDFMFNNNVLPQVYDVFPVDKYEVSTGVLQGLEFMHISVNNPSFYEPREVGSDAKFLNDTMISQYMTAELLEEMNQDIAMNGRTTFIPIADLKGRVKYRLMPIKLEGVPESKYDTPIIFTQKNKSGEDMLVISGRRTIVFKSAEGGADMKKTVEYYLTLVPDGKDWKISGVGFQTLNVNKLLDSNGQEL